MSNLKYYWKHFLDVSDHRWRVFKHCCKLGVPFLGLVHDLSKFQPIEFIPYALFWQTGKGDNLRKNGWYNPYDTGDPDYDRAVAVHVKVNKHHWPFWTMPKPDGTYDCLEMPERYVREMLADWFGAGERAAERAGKKWDLEWTQVWYIDNIDNTDNLKLHYNTKQLVGDLLFTVLPDIYKVEYGEPE